MKKWLFLILLFPLTCVAQTYRYLGVEDGLSNRRVYCIQKDKTGYMWFLTHEGIDRYNGKDFKRYKLMDGDVEVKLSIKSELALYRSRRSFMGNRKERKNIPI